MVTVISSDQIEHTFSHGTSFNSYVPDNSSVSVAYIYKDKPMNLDNLIAFFTNPIAVIVTNNE